MEKKILIFDLDGTLMSGLNDYDYGTFEYLKKIINSGHIVIIATGRPIRSSMIAYSALGLNTIMGNYNSALITNPSDSSFKPVDLRIDRKDLFKILDDCADYIENAFCEVHDDIYVARHDDVIDPFLHTDGGVVRVGPLHDILNENPNGSLLFLKEATFDRFADYIDNTYNGELFARYWKAKDFHSNGYCHIAEVNSIHVDKASIVKVASELYNIPIENIIAFGDGHNDIGLLSAAGYGVAMGNSHPDLLPYADEVIDTIDNNGVLKYLKQHFKI